MSCEYTPVLSCALLNFYMMQSTSLQVPPVVSTLTSTSSSGVPSQQLGTGQLVPLFSYGLLVLLLLAMSNGLCWFPVRDVMLGQ